MRTNLNPKTSEIETHLNLYLVKHIEFYLMPVWLDDTLVASGHNETVLDNREKINSILTAEDIKFYNENITKIYEIRSMLPLMRDTYFKFISDNRNYINGFPTDALCVASDRSSLENSISKKEGLTPFVRNACNMTETQFWHIVARYSIKKLSDKHMIVIRFETCEPGCVYAEQAKEDEKLAEFLIGEFGVQHFANTELFKKILTA